jgi:hypothetical protein
MLLEHKNAIVYGGASSSEPFHHESLFFCRSTIQSVPASNGCIIGLGEEHGWQTERRTYSANMTSPTTESGSVHSVLTFLRYSLVRSTCSCPSANRGIDNIAVSELLYTFLQAPRGPP